jgi:hypothetical protein
VEDVLGLLSAPARIEDARGKILAGTAGIEGPERAPIVSGGVEVGAVRGGAGIGKVAGLVAHLYEREQEKLALATETLGRYKELTVLYDMSSALSRVLDVEEVARKIVAEAHRFLRSSEAALYLLDRRGERLDPVASAGEEATPISLLSILSGGDSALEVRALQTGQAELVEETQAGGSVMVAPLRSGESSFGLLRVASAGHAPWTAGDLKLVTSLAANAASAISHAMLHRDQLRQQALRNQIERFVSPTLLEAALESCEPDARDEPLAVIFSDVGELARSMDASATAGAVVGAMLGATSVAVSVLLEHGATVNTAQGEMIVALVCAQPGGAKAASRALDAAVALARRLDSRFGGPLPRSPGIGVALLELPATADLAPFFEAIGAAASLQAAADGRILAEDRIASALPPEVAERLDLSPAEPVSVSRGTIDVYEVRP